MLPRIQTNRKEDNRQESVLNQFLLKKFFFKQFKNVVFAYDQERQIQGIDVITDEHLIDIKAQSSPKYLNNPTDTFSLELSTLNKLGEEITGWFLNDELKTTAYAFVWVNKVNDVNGKILDMNAVEEVEILLVDKKQLKEYITSWKSTEALMIMAHRMRQISEKSRFYSDTGLKLVCSLHLGEEPVNIVVNKKILKKFSLGHYIVTKTEIKEIT